VAGSGECHRRVNGAIAKGGEGATQFSLAPLNSASPFSFFSGLFCALFLLLAAAKWTNCKATYKRERERKEGEEGWSGQEKRDLEGRKKKKTPITSFAVELALPFFARLFLFLLLLLF
jgi:hypothetical protein